MDSSTHPPLVLSDGQASPLPLHKEPNGATIIHEDVGIEQAPNIQLSSSSPTSQQPKKELGPVAVICLGWNICNSWAAVAATMAVGIPQGGMVTIIYGILVTFVAYACIVGTMAELANLYPTAGGQYHWTSILSPQKFAKSLSYMCGCLNVFAWISITAGVTVLVPEYLLAVVIEHHPDYVPQRWHSFLIYQVSNILILIYNIFSNRRVTPIYDASFILSILLFVIITVTCLARSGTKQSSHFVWNEFTNETGWNSKAVVFLTGMINPNYIFAGIDGAIHVAEECKNAAIVVPSALLSTLLIGFVSAFAFSVAMAYSIRSWDQVLATPTGLPAYEIWMQATKSVAAATTFMILMIIITFVVLIACQHTASRLTWAFARDNALVFSNSIARIHPSLEVPVWALTANAFVVFLVGFVYLGSTTAFNAFIGTGLILQQLCFAFPAVLLLVQRRSSKYLNPNRKVKLGSFGWLANIGTAGYGLLTLVFYCFPPYLPVTGLNMNYSVVVLAAMALFSGTNWIIYAKKKYDGPRLSQPF